MRVDETLHKPTDSGPWVRLLREALTHRPLSVGLRLFFNLIVNE
jgi:hypothetical protein